MCSFVRIYQRGYHWTDSRGIWYWGLAENLLRKSKFILNRVKISGTLHEDQRVFCCRRHKVTMKHCYATPDVFMLTVTRSSTIHRTHCCFSMATMVTWARHSVITHFVIAVVGVLGSVTYDLPVAVFPQSYASYSGFGGLGVACWPLVPKFAGFLGRKKSSARLPSEGKKSRRSHVVDLRHVKDP